jgi:hypothetical protein
MKDPKKTVCSVKADGTFSSKIRNKARITTSVKHRPGNHSQSNKARKRNTVTQIGKEVVKMPPGRMILEGHGSGGRALA